MINKTLSITAQCIMRNMQVTGARFSEVSDGPLRWMSVITTMPVPAPIAGSAWFAKVSVSLVRVAATVPAVKQVSVS